ncbi:lipase, partial [Stutzerimonas stutzeri]
WGKSELTVREAGKLAVAKHTLHLSLLSPCILLILPRSGQAMTSLPAVHLPTTPF